MNIIDEIASKVLRRVRSVAKGKGRTKFLKSAKSLEKLPASRLDASLKEVADIPPTRSNCD